MALTKTSAAMKGYGNSYAETIGLITAGTEVMPNQASKVARGWRSIGANILKLAQDTDTLEAANGKVSVSLKDENGELRSTFQILQDLYPQWKTLNNEERSSLALMLSGKTQTEVFQATMDNFTHAIEANETAMNSQGSAARENEKYLDSIQGRVKAFQSAWEQLSYHIISSDLIKNVVSLGTKIITVIDNIVQGIGALPTALGLVAGAFGALKLTKTIEGFFSLGKAVGEVAEAATEATGAGGIGSFVGSLGKLGGALLPLVPALVAVGGAFAYAHHQYKNSFKGKLEEYEKLTDEIYNLEEQIQNLESKEGELTAEEESRLSILKMQLEILKQQEALKSKQLTNAFNQDAKEKMHGKTHMVQGEAVTEREDLAGDKYIKAAEKRFELQKKIKHLEDEQRMHPLTVEQTKQLEDYNKELDKVYTNEYEALDKVLEEQEALANVDYSKLNADAKAWYDNTHSAYLQASSDIEDVRKAVGEAINTFGSAQFDAWDIDISSLKSADELTAKIKEKIDAMGEDEELTFRVKTDDGSFKEITKKKSELTEEDIDAIVNFKPENMETVLAGKKEASEPSEAKIKMVQEGLPEFMAKKQNAMAPGTVPLTVTDNNTANQTKGKVDSIQGHEVKIPVNQGGATTSGIQSSINSVKGKDVHINIFKTIWESIKKNAKGKRKGEEGGMSWLGDEGSRANPKPELVVGEDGAYLAGTDGWELRNLKASDTVYTASQTKKLLSDGDFDIASIELPRFKKGKKAKKKAVKATNANVAKAQAKVKNAKNKTAKKKAKKNLENLKKKRQKKRDAFDKELEKLQHKAKVNHWTDAKYQAEYKKLYNKYKAYLSGDQSDDYTEAREEYQNEVAKEGFDRRIGNISVGHGNLNDLVADITAESDLSADEKEDLIADAYKASVEYNLKEYKNGKQTRDKILQDIQNYYNTRGKYDETYYKMLDELREADKEKELDRLKTLQKAQDDSLSLAQKYLNKELKAVRKQIDADKEEAEQLEKLTELEKELNKAKSTKIRIYKEGVGFVYEQDIEAINQAEKALTDYQKSLEKNPLEEYAEQLEAILDLFDELGDDSNIKELELALGVSSLAQLTGGNLGTNVNAWTKWISDKYAQSAGYSDLIEQLGNVATSDILNWLTTADNTQVSSSLISQYLSKHSFANGVLSAPGGLSQVGEKLKGELVWLGKGDSVYSNAISKNLMEWGKYSPAQISNINKSGANQIFNFDKIVLPNVHNAETFYKELQNLPNKALQQSTMRI